MVVRRLNAEGFTKLVLALAAHTELSARQRRKDAVAGAIDEDLRLHRMPGVGRQLEARHGNDTVAVHLCIAAGAVEQQIDILFKAHLFIEDAVPDREVALGIAMHVFQQQLFHQSGLLQVAHARARAGNPHADFGARVAAEHRPVVHQDNLCAGSRRRNRGEHAADAAANHTDVRLVTDRLQSVVHFCTSFLDKIDESFL